MGVPIIEMGRLAYLHWNHGVSTSQVESSVPGEPQKVLGIAGLNSTHSHLAIIGAAIHEKLPQGSEVVLYEPSTILNWGLVDMRMYGVPSNALTDIFNLRKKEVGRIKDAAKKLADEQGKPIQVFGHSLGGVLGMAAWLEEPEEIDTLVTAGSPHRMPGIGIFERPDKGKLHSIAATQDWVVPLPFAIHAQSDSSERVPYGHLGLLARRPGITAIANAVTNRVPSSVLAA